MTRLLHITASPRGATSRSAALSRAYVEARRAADPSLEVDELDLWTTPLPAFDGDKAAAKMTFFGEGTMDDPRRSAWAQVTGVADRFAAADDYAFGVPMWNGGVPYPLKHLADVITQPGILFGFDPEKGYFGLLQNKRAAVFLTSGVWAPGAPAKYGQDHHGAWLGWWLGLIGIEDASTVRFQPSLLTADPEAGFTAAKAEAEALAARHAAAPVPA